MANSEHPDDAEELRVIDELSSRDDPEMASYHWDTVDDDDDGAYPPGVWKIPKPNGEPGRPHSGGYNLEEELGAWEPDLLASINMYIKKRAKELLDPTQSYSKQNHLKIAEICSLTSKAFPIVDKYENHWPVRDILKLHLKYTSESHRKQVGAKKGRGAKSGRTADDD